MTVIAVGVSAFLAVSGLVLTAQAARLLWKVGNLRRHGVQVGGEVMDTEVSRPLYNGGRRVAPIVRYRIDTRDYTTTLPNVGEKLALGTSIALAVSAADPYDAVALEYDESALRLLVSAFVLLLGIAFVIGFA